MFGGLERGRTTPRKALPSSKSRFLLVRLFMDKIYRDSFRFGVLKCTAFFVAGIWWCWRMDELNLLPADQPIAQPSPF